MLAGVGVKGGCKVVRTGKMVGKMRCGKVVVAEKGPVMWAIPELDPSMTPLKRKLLLLLFDCILVH